MPEVRRLEERVRELERLAGLHRLGDDGQLLLRREAASTSNASDHFDLRERVGHRLTPRLVPRPSG